MAADEDGLPALVRDETGGLPLFWAESPGPFTAGLVFRVGRADETLATAGITHLVEHLAMPAERLRGVDCNATVSALFATFWAEGEPAAAGAFLEGIAAALHDLPLDRLETERGIVLAEADNRSRNLGALASALRFGAVGHGLTGFDELGLRRLGADDVDTWARARFGAASAAVYMTGPPPRELDLQLPPGTRHPVPDAEPIAELRLPAVYSWAAPGDLGVSWVSERSVALATALAIAEERVRARVRVELGLSYHVEVVWDLLTAELGEGLLWCDCRHGHERSATNDSVAVLEDLAAGGPTDEELEEELERRLRWMINPANAHANRSRDAALAVLGVPVRSDAERLRERREVTGEGCGDALARALATALVLTTEGVELDGFAPYPAYSAGAVTGRRHRPAEGLLRRTRSRLVAGEAGVTFVGSDGELATVRYDECVAVERWADGTRVLWGRDGTRVAVDPAAWLRGGDVITAIDSRVAGELVVPMEAELEARIDHVAAMLAGKVTRGRDTARELDLLPRLLGEDESIVTGSKATEGVWRSGVLVVTDRRALFLYETEVRCDLPLADVDSADVVPPNAFVEDRLVVWARGERHAFWDVDRNVELAAAIRERIRGRDPG